MKTKTIKTVSVYSDEGRKINPQIIRLCNSLARKYGYGRVTEIAYSTNKRDVRPYVNRELSDTWHYETRGGTIINHPSAYSKKGFSNMIYRHAYCTIVLPQFYKTV
jgi:hypothetical protein